MVKLSGAAVERWVAGPDPKHRAVLFYGPNEGLVRNRARSVVGKLAGGNIDDPFGVFICDDSVRNGNPAALLDEAFSLSMIGGDKVIWVRDGGDKIAADLTRVLGAETAANFMVVEAGDLNPRSKLRQAFEKAGNAVAIGCYLDDERSLTALITERFRAFEVRADKAAIDTLVNKLGQDRLANLSEIEKLCLLVGPGGQLDEETVLMAVGDGGGDLVDECVYAVFDGQRQQADQLVARNYDDGVAPVQLTRRFQGHLDRLLTVRGRIDEGESLTQALAKLQPRVFFKFSDRFQRQVSTWSRENLIKCQAALVELEIECKTTGMPDAALCQRIALSISGLARRRGR